MELVHSGTFSETFEACLCLSANVCQMLSSVCLESFLESQIKRKKLVFSFFFLNDNFRVDELCKSAGKEFAQQFSH